MLALELCRGQGWPVAVTVGERCSEEPVLAFLLYPSPIGTKSRPLLGCPAMPSSLWPARPTFLDPDSFSLPPIALPRPGTAKVS